MGTEDIEREDSLAPVSGDRLTVEEEVALMDRGKGGQAFMAVGLLACVAAAGLLLLKGMDSSRVYGELVEATSRLEQNNLNSFVHCALPGTHASHVEAGDELALAIEGASARMPARYATTLRRCARKLGSIDDELGKLETPVDVKSEADALTGAARTLEATVLSYATALSDVDVLKDPHPSAAGIAEAWNAYSDEHETLVSALREKL